MALTTDVFRPVKEDFTKACVANRSGGDDGARTHDPLLAKQVLYQLSYVPESTPKRIGPLCHTEFHQASKATSCRPQDAGQQESLPLVSKGWPA
jgi:hypothetical protein